MVYTILLISRFLKRTLVLLTWDEHRRKINSKITYPIIKKIHREKV